MKLEASYGASICVCSWDITLLLPNPFRRHQRRCNCSLAADEKQVPSDLRQSGAVDQQQEAAPRVEQERRR